MREAPYRRNPIARIQDERFEMPSIHSEDNSKCEKSMTSFVLSISLNPFPKDLKRKNVVLPASLALGLAC
jgi:hypothetical protein